MEVREKERERKREGETSSIHILCIVMSATRMDNFLNGLSQHSLMDVCEPPLTSLCLPPSLAPVYLLTAAAAGNKGQELQDKNNQPLPSPRDATPSRATHHHNIIRA